MSAYGYKRTYGEVPQRVRFTPESRHSDTQERLGLKKRTLDVRFAPESGHSNHDSGSGTCQCPLYPQKQTLERVSLNVRFWLLADSLGRCLERPLYPRKRTFGGARTVRTQKADIGCPLNPQ